MTRGEQDVADAAPPALIIGCGYLGNVTARKLCDAQRRVVATTRTRARWATLGCCDELQQFDIAVDPVALPLPARPEYESPDVFVMLTPSVLAPALVAGGGYDRLLKAVAALNPRAAVLVSSTGVYGGAAGAVVTAESSVTTSGERACRLIEIEQRWCAAGSLFRVCRLAGIYGRDRIIGRRPLLRGDTLPGDPGALLNLIHVEDAAELVIRCAAHPRAGIIELGSDGYPVARAEYYEHLARELGAKPPSFDAAMPARSVSKRCDPSSTWQRLGWSPRYRNYRDGIAASM